MTLERIFVRVLNMGDTVHFGPNGEYTPSTRQVLWRTTICQTELSAYLNSALVPQCLKGSP
ncbi:hypothetical protein M378DRAFT_173790 [Amanita muscaria Koide BX008]|uniref:Uncharacterized protein n=1 Tax=Amanita muscaria (strain Koide BX008) TaxID=946122 RepID=A0A0C2WGL2_AMAMK|nr:hypothetical protein M378DRAFT_173790 [Amanita muscaria Koide BX008]